MAVFRSKLQYRSGMCPSLNSNFPQRLVNGAVLNGSMRHMRSWNGTLYFVGRVNEGTSFPERGFNFVTLSTLIDVSFLFAAIFRIKARTV